MNGGLTDVERQIVMMRYIATEAIAMIKQQGLATQFSDHLLNVLGDNPDELDLLKRTLTLIKTEQLSHSHQNQGMRQGGQSPVMVGSIQQTPPMFQGSLPPPSNGSRSASYQAGPMVAASPMYPGSSRSSNQMSPQMSPQSLPFGITPMPPTSYQPPASSSPPFPTFSLQTASPTTF